MLARSPNGERVCCLLVHNAGSLHKPKTALMVLTRPGANGGEKRGDSFVRNRAATEDKRTL